MRRASTPLWKGPAENSSRETTRLPMRHEAQWLRLKSPHAQATSTTSLVCKLRSECSQTFVSSMSFVQLSVRFASLVQNVTPASGLCLRVVMTHCNVQLCEARGIGAQCGLQSNLAQVFGHELTITATRELPGAL
ncbi:unnamed protein product [Ectocarpus sp. 8 AP-2014]